MKLQNTQSFTLDKYNKTPDKNKNTNTNAPSSQVSFKGLVAPTAIMNFFATNEAMGATLVDAAFMCTPRTAVDFTRSPEAGVETMRREFTSNINDGLLGLYAGGTSALIAKTIYNNKFGTDLSKLKVDSERLDILAAAKGDKDLTNSRNLKNYLDDILNNTKAFNPNENLTYDWIKINKNAKDEVADKFVELINTNDKKQVKSLKNDIKSLLTSATGVDGTYKIEYKIKDAGKEIEKVSESNLDDYVKHIVDVTSAFMKENVAKTFKAPEKNSFIKSVKNLNGISSAIGIGFCALVGAASQPINIWLTKRKTGKSGFVGGGEENKSTKFKVLKSAIATAAGFAALASIDKGKFKDLPKHLKFKSFLPSIPQFKLVYGITIVSRLFSARNENELRESTIKDSLGFVSWLMLGPIASRAAAIGCEKISKMKGDSEKFLKTPIGKSPLLHGDIISRTEILQNGLKKAGISTVENSKALSFAQMIKKAPKAVKTNLRYATAIQLAGYLFSGLVLGIGIPKLNIAITKHYEKKAEEKKTAEKVA